MDKEEGFMKCSGCGMVWKGVWEAGQDVRCPECQSPLEEVEQDELQDT